MTVGFGWYDSIYALFTWSSNISGDVTSLITSSDCWCGSKISDEQLQLHAPVPGNLR